MDERQLNTLNNWTQSIEDKINGAALPAYNSFQSPHIYENLSLSFSIHGEGHGSFLMSVSILDVIFYNEGS